MIGFYVRIKRLRSCYSFRVARRRERITKLLEFANKVLNTVFLLIILFLHTLALRDTNCTIFFISILYDSAVQGDFLVHRSQRECFFSTRGKLPVFTHDPKSTRACGSTPFPGCQLICFTLERWTDVSTKGVLPLRYPFISYSTNTSKFLLNYFNFGDLWRIHVYLINHLDV